MSQTSMTCEWSEWFYTGDGRTEYRYIKFIVVDGVLYAGTAGGMKSAEGVLVPDAGREEVRPIDNPNDVFAACYNNGMALQGGEGAEESCASAIRAFVQK